MFLLALKTNYPSAVIFSPILYNLQQKHPSTASLSVLNLIAHHFTFALHYILIVDVLNWIILLTLTL